MLDGVPTQPGFIASAPFCLSQAFFPLYNNTKQSIATGSLYREVKRRLQDKDQTLIGWQGTER
jgi:hypothetical protein